MNFAKLIQKIIAIELLSVFQGINWFCLFKEDPLVAKQYLKKSVDTIIKGIKK